MINDLYMMDFWVLAARRRTWWRATTSPVPSHSQLSVEVVGDDIVTELNEQKEEDHILDDDRPGRRGMESGAERKKRRVP